MFGADARVVFMNMRNLSSCLRSPSWRRLHWLTEPVFARGWRTKLLSGVFSGAPSQALQMPFARRLSLCHAAAMEHDSADPEYSIRLLRPFLVHLLATPRGRTPFVQKLAELPDDARLPVHKVLRWLESAVELTRDPDLALRAIHAWSPGSGDVLEFAAASAATVGDALRAVLRHVHLLNGAADFSLAIRGDIAAVELHSRVVLTRQAADFQMAALMLGMRRWLPGATDFELWFAHAAPADRRAYKATFGAARLRFGSPHDALLFPSRLLETPIASADEALHKLLSRYAAERASALRQHQSLAARVRKLLLDAMADGDVEGERIAAQVGMSRRTLTRHLAAEGVTYKELLEKTRHQLALQYLRQTAFAPQEVANVLGYSSTASFSRAFVRWEGTTPTDFRRVSRKSRIF